MKSKYFKKVVFLITFLMLFSKNILAQKTSNQNYTTANLETAIIAGGCFWGVEEIFRSKAGIVKTEVGYCGGYTDNPTYETVSSGLTGHAEAVKITFDKNIISYYEILRLFFAIHDPTQLNRQQNDIGTQYRSEIFYTNDNQKVIAENFIKKAEKLNIYKAKIQTKITSFAKFYPAENYHQNYLKKNPRGYNCHYLRPEWQFD